MATKLCIQCHKVPVHEVFDFEFCSLQCKLAFEDATPRPIVEQDIVRPGEIRDVVERALREGWTILAITPSILEESVRGLRSIFIVEAYLIVRSK